jgi:hypothetical protein
MEFKRFSHIFSAVFTLLALAIPSDVYAALPIDFTCKTCPRRQLDSVNVYAIRPVRVNQVGYRPQDGRKFAFVADPKVMQFKVINVTDKTVASAGTLQYIQDAPKGVVQVRGVFNSITDMYNFTSPAGKTEKLYRADFSSLTKEGQYRVVVDADTSALFYVHAEIYNQVLETALKFFGSNRCGETYSWMHDACHLKDGDALGAAFSGRLSGGWHDCGDHGKYAETQAYAGMVLSLVYCLFPQKAEDFYGASYYDTLPFGTDGVPDILWEAKVGADYIYKLYTVSKEQGLIAQADMYHSVGDFSDHSYWDVPEHQDAQPAARGGPPRSLHKGIGSNVAGSFAALLAFFSWGWELYDKPYALKCRAAAIDIYDNVVMKKLGTSTAGIPGYTGGGMTVDDEAMAALALWFVTKEERFGYDLYRNKAIRVNNNVFDDGNFPAGHMGREPFHHGGWTTDYEQINAFVLYAFAKLILPSVATATGYGVSAASRDSLLIDIKACLKRSILEGSNGANNAAYPGINVDEPYHGVFTSVDWGYNRYNMGMVNELFMYWDLTGDQKYFDVGMDNLNYNMGINPWDMSFIMAGGDRNLNHPHNRAANPDGYNAGGVPYSYQSPKGALMGGSKPGEVLLDDWEKYTVTETCIDFSSQLVLPAQLLAKDLPPDSAGPHIFNITIDMITNTSAVVSWQTDELSKDELSYSLVAGGKIIQTIDAGPLATSKSVTLTNLTPATTYYFSIVGMDVRHNISIEDNHGKWYSFTTTQTPPSPTEIAGIRVCNITDNQATVYWWTPGSASTSQVDYGESAALGQKVIGDDSGLPGLFHSVTLKNLKPGVGYYFDVVSGVTRDDNKGNHYRFSTTEVFVDYGIYIKPTKKGAGNAHFYLNVTNNEPKPYTGVELRLYMQLSAAEAADLKVDSYDKGIFDVGGALTNLDLTIGKPVQMTASGFTQYYYLPITIKSELPVAGRARFELQLSRGQFGGTPFPFSRLTDAWSLRPHTSPPDPAQFDGVNFSRGAVYTGPEFVEIVNGVPEITYSSTPYITAYYNGKHVYGYPPDFGANMPLAHKTVWLHFFQPVISPQTSIKQDSFSVNFAGAAWAKPNGNISNIEMNSPANQLAFSPIDGRKDSVTFNRAEKGLSLGVNRFTFVAWHNRDSSDCACAAQRLLVDVDTVKEPPVTRRILTLPANSMEMRQAIGAGLGIRVVNEQGTVVATDTITVGLAAGDTALGFYGDALLTKKIAAVRLTNGEAMVWIKSTDTLNTTVRITANTPSPAVRYLPATLFVRVVSRPPWLSIVKATALDYNADEIPDSLAITLSDTFTTGQALVGVIVEYKGAIDTVAASGAVLRTKTLMVPVRRAIMPDYEPHGAVTLLLLVDGILKQESAPFGDGIGPVVVAAAILEQFGAAYEADSLYLTFSEPVVNPGTAWFYLLYNGAASVTDTPVVGAVLQSGTTTATWLYVLKRPQPVKAGMLLQLKNGATLTDRNGNRAHTLTHAKIPITLLSRPAPLLNAWYIDGDADGVVDTVCIRFERTIRGLAAISVQAAWMQDNRIGVATGLSYRANDSTVITAAIRDAFVTRFVDRTSGTMQVTVTYAAFGTFVVSPAADSAAPVIVSASFLPGTLEQGASLRAPDTLIVVFSEAIRVITSGEPFEFNRGATGYTMTLDPLAQASTRASFLVRSMAGVEYPVGGDSVRINPVAAIADDNYAIQDHPGNKRVALAAQRRQYALTVNVGPNPFTPGKDRIMLAGNPPISTGTTIVIDPQLKGSTTVFSDAAITIFDAVGSVVARCKGFNDHSQAMLQLYRVPGKDLLYILWSGKNSNGRIVGSGTYAAFLTVLDTEGFKIQKRFLIGVMRESSRQ